MTSAKRLALSTNIADYVRSRYRIAHQDKKDSGVYDRMVECHAAWRGDDLEDCKEEGEGAAPRLVLNVTRPLVRGVTALMQRPLASAKARPWTIKPTPKVELSEPAQEKVAQQISRDMPAIVEAAGADPEKIDTIIEKVSEVQLVEDTNKAQIAADKLTTLIGDQLLEAGWTGAFQDFLHNLALYPVAILKEETGVVKKLQWSGTTLTPVDTQTRVVTNISPFDFYPAPGARGVNDAEYIIERRRISSGDLAMLAGAPGYDADAIQRVLTEMPNGHEEPIASAGSTEDGSDEDGTKHFYDALGYYGLLPASHLRDWGVDVAKTVGNIGYEAEVWIVGGITIKAALNPDPLGRRPFYCTAFEPIPGEIFGESPGTDVLTVQRLITATASALVRNLAYSSGPIGEVEMDRVQDGDDPAMVMPGMLRVVSKDKMHGSPAYKFHTVPSLSGELMALLKEFQEYAFTVLGIPRVAFGGPQGLGTIGRTSSGVAALLNQSSNTLYHAMEAIERGVIEPLVQSFIDREMIYGTDLSVKGDLRAYAVGVSGIVEKEAKSDKLQWALQSLAPLMQVTDPASGKTVIPAEAPVRLLYQMFKDAGISTQGIFPDYDRQAAVVSDVRAASPGIQAPPLDGRAAPMRDALAAQNSVAPSA
jgi:hypothetical protein